jgi:putative nucleotidyltransferase with HDIG domain
VRPGTATGTRRPPREGWGEVSEVRLSEIVAALSHALDLTQGQPEGHAGRSCLIALRVADELRLASPDREALYYATLLKDAGCPDVAGRLTGLLGGGDLAIRGTDPDAGGGPVPVLDWLYRGIGSGGPLSRARRTLAIALELARHADAGEGCARGAEIVEQLGFPPAAADAMRGLDERWDGTGRPTGLAGPDIPVTSRIACLAEAADVFLTMGGVGGARAVVRARAGQWFDPAVAEAFLAIPDDDPVWDELAGAWDPARIARLDPAPDRPVEGLDDGRIETMAEAFGRMVDAKSSFTFRHSVRVANVAVALGAVMGLPRPALRELRIAGLLHDIGKLGVPNAILDKPGPLTDREFAVLRRHPAHSEQILERVGLLRRVAEIAGMHHERVDGGGYPRGLQGCDLPLEARILVVADVHDALVSDRPYRAGLPVARVAEIIAEGAGTAFCLDVAEAHREVAERMVLLEQAPVAA